ncbi:PREDICTED: fatty-acid-binding protein 1 [Ipomoea nil]|uniref:fatty-acid-binding protein 1 n=1 Tax=Ipomoea nil TaxID=35883 RepID=UPI000900B318|nr:PREDICTED: fatty-acid-binding protein 1 [Ipomoea nil]
MASLGFPFLFSQPPSQPPTGSSRPHYLSAAACAAAVAAGGVIAISPITHNHPLNILLSNFSPSKNNSSPLWGSLSLSDGSAPATESRTGISFPSVLKGSQRLLGIGLRKKAILGLKNIDVYAFGVYANDADLQNILKEKYETLSGSESKGKDLKDELMDKDIRATVRLQIMYGRLSIRSVRSAFEESVGSRLRKFGGSDDNKELLSRFTSQFRDEIKIPRGAVIELSREPGYILQTTIDGKEVGSIQSKLLCRSILDLYIGDEPFDRKAKDDVELNLASLLQK